MEPYKPYIPKYIHMLDFVFGLEEVLDVGVPPCSAVQEVVVELPGVVGDGLLVDDGDAMVALPVLLVGVCLLGLTRWRRQLTLTTWSRISRFNTFPTVVY